MRLDDAEAIELKVHPCSLQSASWNTKAMSQNIRSIVGMYERAYFTFSGRKCHLSITKFQKGTFEESKN